MQRACNWPAGLRVCFRYPILYELFPRYRNGGDGGAPSVAVNAAGEFVVAWVEELNGGSLVLPSLTTVYRSQVLARRYHADGTPAGTVEVIARRGPQPLGPSNGLHSVVRVLTTPDDGFAVVYSSGVADGPVQGLRSPFSLRRIGRYGRPQGLARKLETGADQGLAISETDFHAAYTAGGELLLTWVTEAIRQGYPGPQAVVVRRYAPDGLPRGAPVQVAERTEFSIGCCSVRVVPMANGASAVLWSDRTTDRQVKARYYSADLSAIGEPFRVVQGSAEAAAVADREGHLLVVQGISESRPEPRQLYLQRFQGP